VSLQKIVIPERIWTQYLGTSANDSAYSVTNAGDGTFYVTGGSYGNIYGHQNYGAEDGFIVKYDSDGTVIWSRKFANWYYLDDNGNKSLTDDSALGSAIGLGNSVVVAGWNSEPDSYDRDGYIINYSSEGETEWDLSIYGAWNEDYTNDGSQAITSVATAIDGSIYVSGATDRKLSAWDQDYENVIESGNISGKIDSFIAKITPTGDPVWISTWGNINDDAATSIKATSNGYIYVGGYTTNALGDVDAYLSKYNANGILIWTQILSSARYEQISSIDVSDSGSIYVTGFTDGNLAGESLSRSGFLAKFDEFGNKNWIQSLGAYPASSYAAGVSAVTDDAIYVAGYINGPIDGQIAHGGYDSLLSKYNGSGEKVWTELLGSSGYDIAVAVSDIDSKGQFYVVGRTNGNFDGQKNSGGTSDYNMGIGGDGFVTQYIDTPPSLSPFPPDYSNDPLNPTPILWSGTVTPYQGLISNSVGEADSADYLTFKVLAGQRLTGITLTSYSSTDPKAFIGLQRGAQVNASATNSQPLIGYTHFGSGQSDAAVGTNLISKLGGVLTEGTYSIWIQQLGAKTDYSFNLELQDNPTFNEPKSVVLPVSSTGTKVTIADTASPDVIATSQSSPDLIEIQAPVRAMLNALTTETHAPGLIARNVGTKTTVGTGQVVPMRGLGKYTFVATAIPEATTTINLEPNKNTAFFLHDAYSAFYGGLTLAPDSSGRQSHQRVLNVDTIFMGSGGGTSIVDLTSKDYVTGAVTVYGADKGHSIFWGTDANDTYISRGGDSVIFGGAGSNAATLGVGRDTLQYRTGVGASDRVEGFDRSKDMVELWIGRDMVTIEPQFSLSNGSTLMQWGGNTIEFVGIADLTLSNLKVINRFA